MVTAQPSGPTVTTPSKRSTTPQTVPFWPAYSINASVASQRSAPSIVIEPSSLIASVRPTSSVVSA